MKKPPCGGVWQVDAELLRALLLLAFALLVGNAAAGLAGGLAGRLAFAASAVLRAFTKIAGIQSLDMLHRSFLHRSDFVCYLIIAFPVMQVSDIVLHVAP